MATTIADNGMARDAVLGRVRKALGKSGDRSPTEHDARRYIDAHAVGPQPRAPSDVVEQFIARAEFQASTLERIARREDIPAAVARYVAGLTLRPALASHRSTAGVCWPELADLDWSGAGLTIEARPTTGDDRLGVTGCFAAIAETGTLVFTTGADTPSATTLLPDTHVAVLQAHRIVQTMEQMFALVRREHGRLPRAINMISGPSRTGDIEQTIVLGAHGPYRVHILLID